MRRLAIPILVLLIAAATLWQRDAGIGLPGPVPGEDQRLSQVADQRAGPPEESRTDLPAEARATIELIGRGGPFPYRQDGSVFQNREGHLPAAARGYYREYTVPTPGAPDRGARRLVTGGIPPSTWYYTDDHYRSFRSVSAEDRDSP